VVLTMRPCCMATRMKSSTGAAASTASDQPSHSVAKMLGSSGEAIAATTSCDDARKWDAASYAIRPPIE